MIKPKFYKLVEDDGVTIFGICTHSELRLYQEIGLLDEDVPRVEISFEEYRELCKDGDWYDLLDNLQEYGTVPYSG